MLLPYQYGSFATKLKYIKLSNFTDYVYTTIKHVASTDMIIHIAMIKNAIIMHGKNVEFGNLIPGKFSLLEANICNFEGKCTI